MQKIKYLIGSLGTLCFLAFAYFISPVFNIGTSVPAQLAEYHPINSDHSEFKATFNLEKNLSLLHQKNFGDVTTNLQRLIIAFLGGSFERAKIEIIDAPEDITPASVSWYSNHEYFMRINHAAFDNAVANGLYSSAEKEKAFLIVLFHELIHVWQGENVVVTGYRYQKMYKMEGHAMFLQGVFADIFGLEDVNLKGLSYLLNPRLVQKLTNTSLINAIIFVHMTKWVHIRGWVKFAENYHLISDESDFKSHLVTATRSFFTP